MFYFSELGQRTGRYGPHPYPSPTRLFHPEEKWSSGPLPGQLLGLKHLSPRSQTSNRRPGRRWTRFPSEAADAGRTSEMLPPPPSVTYFGAGATGRICGYLSVLLVTLQMEDLPFHFCLPWTACQVGLQPCPHAPRQLPHTHRRRLATGLAGQHPAGWGPTSQGASPP